MYRLASMGLTTPPWGVPERDGAFPKRVLTGRTLGMLQHLAGSGLADIQKGAALELAGSHLLARLDAQG